MIKNTPTDVESIIKWSIRARVNKQVPRSTWNRIGMAVELPIIRMLRDGVRTPTIRQLRA